MLATAQAEIGVVEMDRGDINPRVSAYLTAVSAAPATPVPYWGGAFLAWCAIRSRLVPPAGAGLPEAWRQWGTAIGAPEPGAIVILVDDGRLHCGLIVRASGGRLYVIGGAQSGAVNIQRIDESAVVEIRRPPGGAYVQQNAQTVDISLLVDGNAVPVVRESQPRLAAPLSDLNAMRESVVLALAAAAETDAGMITKLAELAAVATAATTVEGIAWAQQEAVTYMRERP